MGNKMSSFYSYKGDRTCEICNRLDEQNHDRCKMSYKLWGKPSLLTKCSHCKVETKFERGTNEYGYDEDYPVMAYFCDKTKLKCEVKETCLDMFIKLL